MVVGEPVEKWTRKPKTGICNAAVTLWSMCVHLCACADFSIFVEHCNSSQTGRLSRLPSLLRSGGEGWRVGHQLPDPLCDPPPAHHTAPRWFLLYWKCEEKEKWWADKKWKMCSCVSAWGRSMLVFECGQSAGDKEGLWMKRVKRVRQSLGLLHTVYLCISTDGGRFISSHTNTDELNLLSFAIYWEIGAEKQELIDWTDS